MTTFLLADHAEAVNGKLYVTGGSWNQIFAPQFPTRHGHLSVAMTIQVPWTMTNEKHSLEIRVTDDDAVSILPSKIGGEFEVGRPPGFRPGDDNFLVAVFNVDGLTFPKAGHYAFKALVDEQELGSLRISVLPLQVQPRTA
jgi:hypothetical protein